MEFSKLLRRKTAWATAIFLQDVLTIPPIGEPAHLLSSKKLFRAPTSPHTRADPFLFNQNGRLFLFYETQAGDDYGRIEAAEVTHNELKPIGTVLAESFHVSYPAVFEMDGEVYMLPESQGAGEMRLYRFTRFPDRIEFVRTLMPGQFADPSPLVIDETLYIFATNDFGLQLYVLEDIIAGSPVLHPASPITNERDLRRCGGAPFTLKGQLVRPAQAFRRRYGDDLSLLAIEHLSPTQYSERPFRMNICDRRHGWDAQGGHHVSTAKFGERWAVAVDGQAYDYYIHKIISRAALWLARLKTPRI